MQIFLTVLVFLFIFSVLILIHEWGHFTAARRSGVKVEEFGFGLPPRVWGVKKGETLYSINAIPFGGFVRMLGEDETDSKKRKDKRSFAAQPLRKQAWIVSAGVVMNLLLAFVLLTVGYWIGVDPIFLDRGEYLEAYRANRIELSIVDPNEADALLEDEDSEVDYTYAPRLVYYPNALPTVFDGMMESGDVLLSLNDHLIYSEGHFFEALNEPGLSSIEVYRPGEGNLQFSGLDFSGLQVAPLIDGVVEDSSAEEAGLQSRDRILAIDGDLMFSAQDILNKTQEHEPGDVLVYRVSRETELGVEQMELEVTLNEEGRAGIIPTEYIPFYPSTALYTSSLLHEVVAVQKDRYTWQAPFVAAAKLTDIGVTTAGAFVGVLVKVVSGGGVPEGVAGPVGIAQLTHVSVQSGFASVLVLMALLSLSLGVINILPIPALDGGRLAFIIYEGVTGYKPSPKVEAFVHTLGFVLLITLLVVVTYNDVLNLF